MCEQEERRLFYVAMTRARESLTIYAKNGKGKNDPTPPGFIRELLGDASSNTWRHLRPARPLQVDMFAEEDAIILPSSNASMWFSMPPEEKLIAQLSASAIDIYERCPLRFKLERDWRMPREIPAALHYGTAMHRALLAYYDAIRLQRDISNEAVIDVFRTLLADAAIQDRYQHDLYLRQGIEQLTAFLESARRSPSPQVLETEASFTIEIGDATIRGRIDRMDRLEDDSVTIIDYKTGKARSQKDADESLQLSIYALAAQAKWKATVGRVAFHNLEDNSRIDTVRNQFDLEEARAKVERRRKPSAKESFRRNPASSAVLAPTAISVLPLRKTSRSSRQPALRSRAPTRTSKTFSHQKLRGRFWRPRRFLFQDLLSVSFSSSQLSSWLPWFYSPFHSSWKFATVICCNCLNV